MMDKSTKILIAINAILIVALGILYFVLFSDSKAEREQKYKKTATTTSVQGEDLYNTSSDSEELQEMLMLTFGKETPKFAVYLLRPNIESQPLIFQSRPMRPASMIKVFVLAKVMQDAKDGKLSLDELITITADNIVGGAGSIAGEGVNAKVSIRKAAELMTIESDNTATNILIDRVGMENINQYLKTNGYNDTIVNHKMMLQKGDSNLSSAADLGKLFTRIYEHTCVDEFYDQLMISYMLKQQDRDCFPAALPYWNVAHKTGEVDNLYDDGGIFYGAKGDFILVIMNDNYESRGETIEKMKKVASQIANKFIN